LEPTIGDAMLQDQWRDKQLELIKLAKETYQWAVDKGIAKEQARAVLPEGNTVSKLYMNGTLRSWVHFIELRSANGTQLEHQEVAIACAKVISTIFPMSESLLQNV
jgi:thymidylate synthase (FAD)